MNKAKEMTTPPFPDKMTFKEMVKELFDVSWMTEDELQTISDAGEMYAKGCLKNASLSSSNRWVKADKLVRGCVVYMKKESGMIGYGNPQCVSWVSHEIGELSLFGHNEHYKTYDVREIIEYPIIKSESPTQEGKEGESLSTDQDKIFDEIVNIILEGGDYGLLLKELKQKFIITKK